MRRLPYILLLLFCFIFCLAARGQDAESEYEMSMELFQGGDEEAYRELLPDVDLFRQPLGVDDDLFESTTRYNFGFVRYQRRGLDDFQTAVSANGIDLRNLTTQRTDYSLADQFRVLSPSTGSYRSALSGRGDIGGEYNYDLAPGSWPSGHRVLLYNSDRTYRYGMRYNGSWGAEKGWRWLVAANRRFGRDATVEGVFGDYGSAVVGAARTVGFGRSQTGTGEIVLLSGVVASERGLRSYSAAEAFGLTDDNYYNPSWGYYGGRVRNSRVERNLTPSFTVRYRKFETRPRSMELSFGLRFSSRGRTALGWYGAPNPWPDYYRYMPSSLYGDRQRELAGELWRSGDASVTQVDWNDILRANDSDQPGYVLEERIERIGNMQFAADLYRKMGEFTLHYGGRLTLERNHNFKKARDMLGAMPFSDRDPFLSGPDAVSDLSTPERMVSRGGRFGYDYNIDLADVGLYARLSFRKEKFSGTASANAGAQAFYREGNFDKGVPRAGGSLGRSDVFTLLPAGLSLKGEWYFSFMHRLVFDLFARSQAPAPATVFCSPQYYNAASWNGQVAFYGGQAKYRMSLHPVRFGLSLFGIVSRNESRQIRYWSDIEGIYCDMSLTGIDKMRAGAEAAAQLTISRSFTLDVAAAVGRYRYCSDPEVDIRADAGGARVVSGDRSAISGLALAGTPEAVLTSILSYRWRGSLWSTLSVNYMAGRYVDVSPLRRMERATSGLEGSALTGMISQERLADAVTLNFTFYKSFRTRFGSIDIFAAVNNLLDNRNVVYNGYEQQRLFSHSSGGTVTYSPFASKYLYSYPRTYYLRLGCRF